MMIRAKPSPRTTSKPVRSRAAFTLVELIAVLVLMSILAVSSVPVIDKVGQVRERVLANEIASTLRYTRQLAVASGFTIGLQLQADDQIASLLRIDDEGTIGAYTPLGGSDTGVQPLLGDQSASFSELQFGEDDLALAGLDAPDAIWFDFSGVPHTRSASGDSPDPLVDEVRVTIGNYTVSLHPLTAFIEVNAQ